MSDLETTLRKLAAAGELTYLSVVPVAGRGDHGVVFTASYSPASQWGHGFGRNADPVKAIEEAIAGAKIKRKLAQAAIDDLADFTA